VTVIARPVRHIGLATVLVLVVGAVIGGVSLASYREAGDTLRVLTARATGTVTGASAGAAVVTWAGRSLTVAMSGGVPPVGTRTQIAYDPADPSVAIIPGAALLTSADRSRDGVLFAAFLLVLVLLVDGWLLASRRWAARRPGHELVVRRISVRRGLMARTWLETEDSRWIPVYFDRAVVTLPAPTSVLAHG